MSQRNSHQQSAARPLVGWLALVALVSALAIAGAVWWRPALYATGLWSHGGSPTVSPTFFDDPSSSPSPPSQGLGVQDAASAAPTGEDPTAAGLAKRLGAISTKGMGTTTGVVMDATTGKVLWQRGQGTGLLPASTLKLATCTAALQALGPDATFTTRVVSAAKGRIVLVGGGDPYLASTASKTYPYAPSSATLAASTARALKAQHVSSVTLGVDDSLFSGPGWHPAWPQGYHDQVSTIGALWIDKGRPTPTAAPSTTPATTAGQVFATQLKANGIKVTGKVTAARAGTGDAPVASIASLPLRTIVAQTLLHSDNSAAEVLLRQVGVAAHQGGSFTGGAAAVRATLVKLGLWDSKASVQVDGSGLSRTDRTTAAVLARALHVADTTPRLGALLEQLPVAGVDGTLGTRFTSTESAPGRGVVNAKTGTLTQVSSLAGTTVDAHGTPLVFSFVSNGATQEWNVRTWLDDMATAVSKS